MSVEILRPGPVSLTSTPPTSSAPFFVESVVVGGGSQWADDDDATYSLTGHGASGHADSAYGEVPGITFDPALCTNLVVRARVKVDTYPDTPDPRFTVDVFDTEGFPTSIALWAGGVPGFDFDSISDLVYDYAAVGAIPPPDMAALFVAPRNIFAAATTSVDDATYLVRTYELSLEFTYGGETALVRRACRQFPRDDILGIGSANRIHPPPRGRRVAGGFA